MSPPIITVEGLGKKYRIGRDRSRFRYRTLRESLVDLAKAPLRRLREGRQPDAEFWALRDVSFEVQEGEVLGVIGANGSGKSTLLKVLSRITEPTEGRAVVRGRVASLLEVGTGFHPELTGRENVYLNGAILGMRRAEIERKFDEIVAFSEIEKFLDTPVKRYSSGMYVRLAFAVAAHLDPEILLVDEVLSVGDAAFQKKCLGKMHDAATGGRTVLFVSHNLAAVQSLCHSAVWLKSGTPRALGSAPQTVQRYVRESSSDAAESLIERRRAVVGWGNRLRLTSVQVLNRAGTPARVLSLGEPFSVVATFVARTLVRDASIVIGVDTLGDQPVVAEASEEEDVYVSARAGDTVTVRARFRHVRLNSGEYSIRVGARTRDRKALDLLRHAAEVTVASLGTDEASRFVPLAGLVRSGVDWHVVRPFEVGSASTARAADSSDR